MMLCRICGATTNLKFTPSEIRGGSQKSKRLPLPLKEIANAISGNICKFCDLRVENLHREASPVEIDITDDERFCEMFYKRPYVQNGTGTVRSLGSDGDAEVIDLLTSRETTPDIPALELQQHEVKPATNTGPRIVEVIDLDDDNDDDDNNSIGKVLETASKQNSQIREENLLGCLNLVTSDSESSEIQFEPCHKSNIKKEKTPPKIPNNTNDVSNKDDSESSEHIYPVCEVCGTRFLDTASLFVHTKDNHQLPCPVCALQFKTDLQLVYHIRQKHRQYNGDKLCEGAKCAQDSAMTIRLRFDHSFTFYECQLCGNIDTQFRYHKEHIIQNHADESKSLRDPMMKTKLSCPACNQKIGNHQVDVCRHVMTKHPEKCEKYLREVKDLSTLPIKKPKTLETIQHSARILSFIDKEERFYECQLCSKIFGSANYFLTHLNAHNIDEWTEYEKRKSGNKTVPLDTSVRSKRKSDEHKCNANNNVKEKETNLPKNKKVFERQQQKCMVHVDQFFLAPPPITDRPSRKSVHSQQKSAKREDETFKKPLKQAPTQAGSIENKRLKKLKRRSKNGTTIVKVKPPVRNFPTQKYECKHCQSIFKGFRKLHMHLLQKHCDEEFRKCQHCPRLFTSETGLADHVSCLHTDAILISKRKRKQSSIEREKVDENFNKEHSTKRQRLSDTEEANLMKSQSQAEIQQKPPNNAAWLKELYQLSREKSRKVNNSNSLAEIEFFKELSESDKSELSRFANNVCRYCARLFAAPLELSNHEKLHTNAKHCPWIILGTLTQA